MQSHENSIHLYKSPQAPYVALKQASDYAFVFFTAAFLFGSNQLMFLPMAFLATQMPRKLSVMKFFTFHAELLPHTEQVILHKVTLFGTIERHIVDIRNLEKIDSSAVASPLMWQINMFDPDLCFRDADSKEMFVFDKDGFWNKEALEHPLLH